MPVPRLTYDLLCSVYGEQLVRQFYVPLRIMQW